MKLPRENRPEWTTNVQWKSTDLCMDFWCPECGEYTHFTGLFGYYVQCGSCETRFEMPTDLALKKVEKQEGQMTLFEDGVA